VACNTPYSARQQTTGHAYLDCAMQADSCTGLLTPVERAVWCATAQAVVHARPGTDRPLHRLLLTLAHAAKAPAAARVVQSFVAVLLEQRLQLVFKEGPLNLQAGKVCGHKLEEWVPGQGTSRQPLLLRGLVCVRRALQCGVQRRRCHAACALTRVPCCPHRAATCCARHCFAAELAAPDTSCRHTMSGRSSSSVSTHRCLRYCQARNWGGQ
jgi:hypothetical protein